MQTIISDRYYDQARKFIQDRVHNTLLSEEIRNKLVDLYNSLTFENSEVIYKEAIKIYNDENRKQWREFQISCLKNSGIGFLLGLMLFIIGNFGHRYTKKNSFLNSLFSWIWTFGFIMLSLSILFGLSPWLG